MTEQVSDFLRSLQGVKLNWNGISRELKKSNVAVHYR
jgi:hypothetical protein